MKKEKTKFQSLPWWTRWSVRWYCFDYAYPDRESWFPFMDPKKISAWIIAGSIGVLIAGIGHISGASAARIALVPVTIFMMFYNVEIRTTFLMFWVRLLQMKTWREDLTKILYNRLTDYENSPEYKVPQYRLSRFKKKKRVLILEHMELYIEHLEAAATKYE
jgi:hypothetical protein